MGELVDCCYIYCYSVTGTPVTVEWVFYCLVALYLRGLYYSGSVYYLSITLAVYLLVIYYSLHCYIILFVAFVSIAFWVLVVVGGLLQLFDVCTQLIR